MYRRGQQKHKIPDGMFNRANTKKAYIKLTSFPMILNITGLAGRQDYPKKGEITLKWTLSASEMFV